MPRDACLLAVNRINVVEANGGGSDEAHAAALEQAAVATGAGADNQSVGIPDEFGREVLAGYIDGFVGQRSQGLTDEGYFVINDYFHVHSLF